MFRILCGTEKDVVKAKEKSLQAPSRNFKNYLSFGNVNAIKYVIVTNVVFVRVGLQISLLMLSELMNFRFNFKIFR